MRTGLGVLVMGLVGCVGVERGMVEGELESTPEEAEISFIPEDQLRPYLERRLALRAQLELLSAQRVEAERELRQATDESLVCRLALVRAPPPRPELERQKQKLSSRSAAALSHRRALWEWTDAARREALLPPPPAELTVTASRAGHFEAALAPGRYGVAVRHLAPDGRWHTSLAWTEVEAGAVAGVEPDDSELSLEQ